MNQIKRKDITVINIDDYIRQEKKKLFKVGMYNKLDIKRFYWNKREWEIMAYFTYNATCEIFTGKNGIELKEGLTFMGVKHFKLKL